MPAPGQLDPDLVARAAAVIGSCLPDDGVARNATHLWLSHLSAPRIYFRLVEQLDCLANAACGCAAIEHCLGFVYRPAPAVCVGKCQGNVFTGCGDEVELTVDCGRLGLSCDSAATCIPDVAVACDSSEAPSCSASGEVRFCNDGFIHDTPCQALGFSCVAGKCVGTGDACKMDSGFAEPESVTPLGTGCSGGILYACLGGQSTSIDCETQGPGFTCQSLDGKFFCGLAAECLPASNYAASGPETCDGTKLGFCNAGRLEHLDCTKLGFAACDMSEQLGHHYGCTPGPVSETAR